MYGCTAMPDPGCYDNICTSSPKQSKHCMTETSLFYLTACQCVQPQLRRGLSGTFFLC